MNRALLALLLMIAGCDDSTSASGPADALLDAAMADALPDDGVADMAVPPDMALPPDMSAPDMSADFFGGQPGSVNSAPTRYLDIAAGSTATCAIDLAGDLRCWGRGNEGEATPPAGTFSQISMYARYACGLRDDGTIACWGGQDRQAHVDPPGGAFITVDAGGDWACGLRPAGTIECWGRAPAAPPAGSYRHLTVGLQNACAIADDGTVACWGNNRYGQGDPPAGVEFLSVETGYETSCGLRADTNTVQCWGAGPGEDSSATPAGGTFVGFELNWDFTTLGCGWRADGTLRCWGDRPTDTYPSRPVREISVGEDHACALYLNGEAYCWGDDRYGQSTVP